MTNRYQGVDPMLTNVAIAYSNESMVADIIFPALPVKKQSAKHFVYDRGRFRLDDTERGAGAPSNEVTLGLSTGSAYFCEDHALKQFVPDEDVDNAETPDSPYIDATENVMSKLKIAKEKELADMLADTNVLTQNVTLSGTDQWSDYTNSDPFDDIETAKQTIHAAIGVEPNTLILGKQVWDKLKHHPDFLERVKYSQRGVITTDLLAALVGVERVIVAAAYYVNSDEGQTETTSYVWGKNAILAYIAPRIAPKVMTLGYTYLWNATDMKVERLRGSGEEDRKGTNVRAGDYYYDQKIVAAAAGYLIKNCVA